MKQIIKLRLEKEYLIRITEIAKEQGMKSEQWCEQIVLSRLIDREGIKPKHSYMKEVKGVDVRADPLAVSILIPGAIKKEALHRKQLQVTPMTLEMVDGGIEDLKKCKDLFTKDVYDELMTLYLDKKYSIEF